MSGDEDLVSFSTISSLHLPVFPSPALIPSFYLKLYSFLLLSFLGFSSSQLLLSSRYLVFILFPSFALFLFLLLLALFLRFYTYYSTKKPLPTRMLRGKSILRKSDNQKDFGVVQM